MKKIFYFLFAAILAFTACSKDDNDGSEPSRDANDKYRNGFYVLNEGQGAASLNFFYNTGKWALNIYAANNDDQVMGVTGTVGLCHGDKMYVATKEAPYLVELGLSDFKKRSELGAGAINGQVMSFALTDEKHGVLTTSMGAYTVTLDPLSMADAPFYGNRNSLKGDVAVAGGYLFLLGSAANGSDVIAIDVAKLQFVKNVGKATTGFAKAGGMLWAANGNKLVKINPTDLTSQEITLDNGLQVYYNQWAFTPTGLKASPAGDALYFISNVTEGYSVFGRDVYKYTIATGKTEKIFTAPVDTTDPKNPLTFSVYGSGLNIDPATGDVYVVYSRDGWGGNFLVTDIYVLDADGKQKAKIPYTTEQETVYWFPSMIIFR